MIKSEFYKRWDFLTLNLDIVFILVNLAFTVRVVIGGDTVKLAFCEYPFNSVTGRKDYLSFPVDASFREIAIVLYAVRVDQKACALNLIIHKVSDEAPAIRPGKLTLPVLFTS
jgi:hypothetical protein